MCVEEVRDGALQLTASAFHYFMYGGPDQPFVRGTAMPYDVERVPDGTDWQCTDGCTEETVEFTLEEAKE